MCRGTYIHVRPLERPQPWILSPGTLDARVNHYFAGQHSTAQLAEPQQSSIMTIQPAKPIPAAQTRQTRAGRQAGGCIHLL